MASSNIGALSVDLVMKTGGFSRNVNKAERDLKGVGRQAGQTQTKLTRLHGAFNGIAISSGAAAAGLAAMAGAFVTNQLAGYTAQAVSTTAALGNMADASGVSAEKLQELNYAMRQFDADAELKDVAEVLATLSDRAQDALAGTQSFVDDFALIGISVDDLRGKNPAELFRLFAEAIQNTENQNTRLTAAVRTLGDDLGLKLLPLLSKGADGFDRMAKQAHEANAVLGDDLVKTAQEVDQEFKQLSSTLATQFKRSVLVTIQDVKDLGAALGDLFDIGEQPLEEKFGEASRHMARLREEIQNVPKGSMVWNTMRDEIDQTAARMENLRQQIQALHMESRALGARNTTGSPPATGGSGNDGGGNSGGTGRTIANSLPPIQTITVPDRPEPATVMGRASQELGAFEQTLPSVQTAQIKEDYDQLRKYARLYYEDTAKLQTRLSQLQTAEHKELARIAGDSYGEMSQYAIQAQRNIQTELGDTLQQTLSGNFDGILSSWTNMLNEMVAQAAAAQINEALFGKTGGGESGGGLFDKVLGGIGTAIGGWFGGPAGASAGGASASSLDLSAFGGFFADGGQLPAGKWSVVGERGPELVTPGGAVIPNHAIAPSGSSPVVNLDVQVISEGGPPMRETRRTRTRSPDGREQIKIHVESVLNEMANSGALDGPLSPFAQRQGRV